MSRRACLNAAIWLTAGLSVAGAQAAGDPAKGAELAITCMGCHGIPGYRNAYPSYRVPKLGGQNEDYMVIALQEYRSKARNHPTMQAQAASLSDEDMQNLAAFFSSLGAPTTSSPAVCAAMAPGKEKAAVCAACHGEAGVSSAAIWPNLAGQHSDYLVYALSAYKDKSREEPVMGGLVMSLSAQDIRDIADYFSAQPGSFTVP